MEELLTLLVTTHPTVKELLSTLISSNPNLILFLVIVGYLRLTMKPLMMLISKVVKSTKTDKDDLILEKITKSSKYELFLFLLDLLASIKIKKK